MKKKEMNFLVSRKIIDMHIVLKKSMGIDQLLFQALLVFSRIRSTTAILIIILQTKCRIIIITIFINNMIGTRTSTKTSITICLNSTAT